jgi:hypothetical protein
MRLGLAFTLVLLNLQTAGAQHRDLTKLDACTILTTADVEAAAKGKQQTPQVGGGIGAVHCGYVLQLPDKTVEQYDFYLNDPTVVADLWKAFPNNKGTAVPGLWEAYLQPSEGTPSQLSLTALHRGDIAFEIQGPRKDVLVALAKTAIGRLR